MVLARILDDPTFSVLNSLIYFNQVEIVQHIHQNQALVKELFSIFTRPGTDMRQKKDAVLLIQQCCNVAKNLQPSARHGLFHAFIQGGLYHVVIFAFKHPEAQVRAAGIEILMAMMDNDHHSLRIQVMKAVLEKQKPLTDTLIELLLMEPDLGVKSSLADAIKVLLEPNNNVQALQDIANSEGHSKYRSLLLNSATSAEQYVQDFYNDSARKLFKPLRDLDARPSSKYPGIKTRSINLLILAKVRNLSVLESQLYTHLVEILAFFIRSHTYKAKQFVSSDGLNIKIARL